MHNILYSYKNFWPNFDVKELLFLVNIAKKNFINLIDNQIYPHQTCDILFCSVFGDIEIIKKHKAKIKILYTRENLYNHSYTRYLDNLDIFDFVIGFEDKYNIINIPYYYNIIKNYFSANYNLDIKFNQLIKRKNFCLISQNPHSLRLQILDSLINKNYKVDCPGYVGHNMTKIVKNGRNNKINFIRNYYFNICPENSHAIGYTTEKLFDCCVAGCVPIYYGCDRLCDGFYNKSRILHIKKDLSNYDNIIEQTINLIENKDILFNFISQPSFHPDYKHYISKIDNKLKHLFEKVLEKL